MCCGSILCILSDRVFKLPCRDFSGHFRLIYLLFMSCRVILRDDWSECGDGSLCCRLVLGRLCKCLYKLFGWVVFIFDIFDKLLDLSCRLISDLNRINCLYGMPWRVFLRHCRSLGSDWILS